MSTKEKILDLAEHYIQHNGYNGFSYHDISSVLGIKNAAVHYHFPKKEELANEVIKKAQVQFENIVEKAEVYDVTYTDKVRRFLTIYDNNLRKENRVCLIGSFATNLDALPPGLNAPLAALVAAIKSWLTMVLAQGREAGEFHFRGSPGQRAALICSGMAGALQLAKILGNEEYYEIKSQLLNDLV
ncbi:MAG: TetR/AcrR family transcriptional regulator [Cytophagales bacterium]|nr:TetR/AcrR family transcriptional regulator [Cytophagales bacterium]